MAIRYFRNPIQPTSKVGVQSVNYGVVNDKPTENDTLKVGHVSVTHTPTRDVPVHYNGPLPYGSRYSHYDALAKELGLHQQYLSHLHRQSYDELERVANTWGEEDPEYETINDNINAFRKLQRIEPKENRGIPFAKAVTTLRRSGIVENAPNKLFEEVTGNTRVSEAIFDKSLRTSFPTAMSIVRNDFPLEPLEADSSLSEHSSKLSQHAASLGLVSGHADNPDMDATNGLDFSDQEIHRSLLEHAYPDENGQQSRWDPHLGRVSEIPSVEVNKARTDLRETLKASRAARSPQQPQEKLSSQFSQPMLPGMDRFMGSGE